MSYFPDWTFESSQRPSFPGEHQCMDCLFFVGEHSNMCEFYGRECNVWLPHCCRGCGCRTFHDAHPMEILRDNTLMLLRRHSVTA